MQKIDWNTLKPHLLAAVVFIVITFGYFSPVLDGKVLNGHDIKTWKGGAKEALDYREATGEESLWTNSMFSGMPTYLITLKYWENLFRDIWKGINLNQHFRPANYFYMALFAFYFMLLIFRINPYLSIGGAIAYAFSTNLFILATAGHAIKVQALAVLPLLIGGVYMAFYQNRLKGAVLLAVAMTFHLIINHLQMTYYAFMIILIFGIFELVKAIKEKKILDFTKTFGLLAAGVAIAIVANAASFLLVYEYSQHSTRSPSELTISPPGQEDAQNDRTSGLDKSYITQWSYGIAETMTLLIPDFSGDGGSGKIEKGTDAYKKLVEIHPGVADLFSKQAPTYWGKQQFTAGPNYIGAIVVFLFVFGLVLVKGRLKWWLLIATVLAIMLAWGKHMMWFSELFIDYFPGYNKFRDVTMTLVIVQFTMPLLGFLALKQVMERQVNKEDFKRALMISGGIVAGLLVFFIVLGGALLDFKSANDMLTLTSAYRFPEEIAKKVIPVLQDHRKYMMRADALRSLTFVAIGAGILWLAYNKKISKSITYAAIVAFVLLDLAVINWRYLNPEHLESREVSNDPFSPTPANQFILQDKDYNRVLNLTADPFRDAQTPYFHYSIGGYHGAKMKRYQELIDFHISANINSIINAFQNNPTEQQIDSIFEQQYALNMLNTKYLIYNPEAQPLINKSHLGNAWFVDDYQIVENADAEIMAMNGFNPTQIAIVDKRFEQQLKGFKAQKDGEGQINLSQYDPKHMVYSSNASSEQLAVFSEIYYSDGWNAYIDGKPAEHFRCNYVLRAMRIPKGEHTVEFKFEPQTYYLGRKISLAGSIILLLAIGGVFFADYKKKNKQGKKEVEPTNDNHDNKVIETTTTEKTQHSSPKKSTTKKIQPKKKHKTPPSKHKRK